MSEKEIPVMHYKHKAADSEKEAAKFVLRGREILARLNSIAQVGGRSLPSLEVDSKSAQADLEKEVAVLLPEIKTVAQDLHRALLSLTYNEFRFDPPPVLKSAVSYNAETVSTWRKNLEEGKVILAEIEHVLYPDFLEEP